MKKLILSLVLICSVCAQAYDDWGIWITAASLAQVRPFGSSIYFEVWTDAGHTTKTGFTFTGNTDIQRNQILAVLLTAAANGQSVNFSRISTGSTNVENVTLETP